MVQPSKRTRSVKKVKVRTPGSRTTTHFRSKKASKPKSAISKKPLSGVASGSATKLKNMPKSMKTPSRPYAGVLSPSELDELMRYVTRMEAKYTVEGYEDVEVERNLVLEKYLPRGWFEKVKSGYVLKRKPVKNPVRKAPKAQAKPQEKKKKEKEKVSKKKKTKKT